MKEMGEKKVEVVVMPREVLYHAGTAHAEGARLTMRECDVRPFEEQGVVTRVPGPVTARGPRIGHGGDSGIPLAPLFS
jgi:hypothetical protein